MNKTKQVIGHETALPSRQAQQFSCNKRCPGQLVHVFSKHCLTAELRILLSQWQDRP